MPIDTSIYGGLLGPQKSALDYQNEYATADARRNQNALQSLQLRQAAQADQERNALRTFLASGADISTADGMAKGYAAAPLQFGPIAKSFQDRVTSQAQAEKDRGQAASSQATAEKTTLETQIAKANKAITDITALGSPQDALTSIRQHLAAGDIDEAKAQGLLATLQPVLQDPSQFGAWQRKMILGIMDAKDRIAATAPKVQVVNTGGAEVPMNTNADAGAIGPVGAPMKKTVSPDTAYTQGQENARAAANREAENLRAGYGKDGVPTGDMEVTAQAIANGQLPPPSGMALVNPKNQRILARVMEINPQYDFTSVTAKKTAASGFTSGQQGNQMRSFATSGQHLDQLTGLIDALNNGDNQTVNKIGNAISAWNGNEQVSNFDAAKDVVAKEVMKAIVAGGGGQSEREELSKSLSSAKSPQQLKGVVKQYRNLMTAQYDNLLAQRRAAGLPDTTLPNYDGGQVTKPTLPFSSDAIAAEIARRGGK
jgi:hypothetical protein